MSAHGHTRGGATALTVMFIMLACETKRVPEQHYQGKGQPCRCGMGRQLRSGRRFARMRHLRLLSRLPLLPLLVRPVALLHGWTGDWCGQHFVELAAVRTFVQHLQACVANK